MIKRGTGRGLKDLNLDLAGKTGTTNKNNDTWFIGFTSKLVIGVYIGMDEPESLGRYETGAKTAMPVFKNFVKKAIKKKGKHLIGVAPGSYWFYVFIIGFMCFIIGFVCCIIGFMCF